MLHHLRFHQVHVEVSTDAPQAVRTRSCALADSSPGHQGALDTATCAPQDLNIEAVTVDATGSTPQQEYGCVCLMTCVQARRCTAAAAYASAT